MKLGIYKMSTFTLTYTCSKRLANNIREELTFAKATADAQVQEQDHGYMVQ